MCLQEFVNVLHMPKSNDEFVVMQYGDNIDYVRRYEGHELYTNHLKSVIEKGECEIKQVTVPGHDSAISILLEGKFIPEKEGVRCFGGRPIKID